MILRARTSKWCSRRAALAGLLVAMIVPCACADDDECQQEMCEDLVRITFDKATPWGAGEYEFVLRYDDRIVMCAISLPYDPTALVDYCDDESTVIGNVVPSSGAAIGGVYGHGSPASVSISILFEGQLLANATFDPEYERTPRPRRCGPPCQSALLTMPIP